MKAILIVVAIAFAVNSYCQDSIGTKKFYLQKSKDHKTIGWILLAGGAAMGTAGTIIFANSNFLFGNDPDSDLGAALVLGGAIAVITSIPFFISSAHNARKAATLSFGTQKVPVPLQNGTAFQLQPSVGLKINF